MEIKSRLIGIGKLLRRFIFFRPKVSHASLVKGALLLLIIIIASGIRLMPLRWGFYLNEFDPYFHYYVAKYISENGIMALFSWRDTSGWYPYGRDMRYYANYGLTLTAVALYKLLSFLGIPLVLAPNANPLDPLASDPLYNLCVIFPIIMTALTCIAIYFLGRDLGGDSVGLFAALLLALDISHSGRTSLGWFDDETIGIFSIILLILFFTRAIDLKKTLKASIIYAISSGLSLSYLCASWGAARYVIGMIALFTFILLILKRYSPRLLLSYTITFSVTFLTAYINPRAGLGFLVEASSLPVYGVLFLLCLAEMSRRIKRIKMRVLCVSTLILVLAATYGFLVTLGYIRPIGGKYLMTIIPSLRAESPLFESVAEHKPSAWTTFYYNFGVGIIFALAGIFFAAQMATNLSILTIIYCLTAVYFASSLIRLNILLSPAICLLWALSLKRIISPLLLSLEERAPSLGRKVRLKPLEKEVIGTLLIIIFIVFSLTYVFGTGFLFGFKATRALDHADIPSTIAGAGLSAKPSSVVRDWIDTLIWMRENLPSSAVVASWWDYGYWITVVANKTTLADNGTINGTQIARIGEMFMSNETMAIEILKTYNVTHVVVYVTFFNTPYDYISIGRNIYPNDAFMYGGDNGKWMWMALISRVASDRSDAYTKFGNLTLGWGFRDINGNGIIESGEIFPNTGGQSTVLYKLMFYGRDMTLKGYSMIKLEYFEKEYFSQKEGSPNPAPGTNIVPLVCVYRVKYE